MRLLEAWAEIFRRECVVESYSAAGGQAGDDVEGRAEGGEGEIGDDAEPAEEGWTGEVEASFRESLLQGVMLEVEGHIREVDGLGNGRLAEQIALPELSGGKIDLEDPEMREGIAIGECVEASAEEDVLGEAFFDGCGEIVFGIAAAGRHEGAEDAGSGVALFVAIEDE